MAWTWQFETADGIWCCRGGVPRETFASSPQGDAGAGSARTEELLGAAWPGSLLEESRVETAHEPARRLVRGVFPRPKPSTDDAQSPGTTCPVSWA